MSHGCGIVLIKTKDPLGRIVQGLCSTLGYSATGFYINDDIFIVDVLDGQKPIWIDTYSMNELMSNIHIDKICIRPILNFSDYDLIKNWKSEELEPNLVIKSIITRNINNTIFWINKLVLLMHGHINYKTIDNCIKNTVLNGTNYKDKMLVLKEFTKQDKLTEKTRDELMRAYIITFPNMGELREIELYDKNKVYDRDVILDLGTRMEYYIKEFSHMLAKNEDGILTILLNILSISQNISNDKEDILSETNNNINSFITFFNSSLENGLVNYDKYLCHLFKIIHNIRQYGELSDLRITNNPKIKIINDNKHLVVSVNNADVDHSTYVKSIKNIKNIINGIKEDIENDDNVIIDINSLIANINDLCLLVKVDELSSSINNIKGNYSIPCAVVVTDDIFDPEEIKINESSRYITNKFGNIENYSNDELKVLLNKLEVLSNDDPNKAEHFNSIKIKIIERLSR